MIDIQDIQSLTDFQRNARGAIARLKKTGRPGILTVNGRAELVVLDTKSYRHIMAKAEGYDSEMKLRRSLGDIKAGRVYDLETVFDELDAKYLGAPLRKKKAKK